MYNTHELAAALAARPPHEVAEIVENVFDHFRTLVPEPLWEGYSVELAAVGVVVAQACQRPLPPPKPPITIG